MLSSRSSVLSALSVSSVRSRVAEDSGNSLDSLSVSMESDSFGGTTEPGALRLNLEDEEGYAGEEVDEEGAEWLEDEDVEERVDSVASELRRAARECLDTGAERRDRYWAGIRSA